MIIGTLNWPLDMYGSLAAWLMIWSMARSEKLIVMISTIGFSPARAAPTAAPTNPDSDMGVSRTRSGPYLSRNPRVTAYAPSYAPMSSPIRRTFSSPSMASRSPCAMASLKIISAKEMLQCYE